MLDALEQVIHNRRLGKRQIQHTVRGVQYLSISYSERLAEIRITPSVGRTGSTSDNDLGRGTVIGLFKTEAVEFTTLDWFSHRPPLGPINYIPPAETEEDLYATLFETAKAV